MKASELRIGNLIFTHKEEIIVVKGIDTEGLILFKEDQNIFDFKCKPIPLTEEWLLKFGFKKDLGNDLYLDSTSTSFFIWQNNRVELLDDKNNICISHCEYVHQLQNLFFALSGEELK